ncbi:MAG: type II toxin-antitoxin system RelB/DinJ family antitoxin [Fibrobacter sp.]|nr:type II toxin-antitoxin system RelB/DinJ family antitoxin [Fibrobacter sp.]
MAQATISARIDAEDKERFDRFCNNVGLSSSAAIYMFIKNVINEHRIPFVVREPDAVYSAKNMKFLEEGIAALNAGKGVAHELIDEEG